jgi:hypothetical protein
MITTSTVEHGARLSISWALSTASLTQLGIQRLVMHQSYASVIQSQSVFAEF